MNNMKAQENPSLGIESAYPNIKLTSITKYTDYDFRISVLGNGISYKIRILNGKQFVFVLKQNKWFPISKTDMPIDHYNFIKFHLKTFIHK